MVFKNRRRRRRRKRTFYERKTISPRTLYRLCRANNVWTDAHTLRSSHCLRPLAGRYAENRNCFHFFLISAKPAVYFSFEPLQMYLVENYFFTFQFYSLFNYSLFIIPRNWVELKSFIYNLKFQLHWCVLYL
jgi:hypothetical protein